MTVNSELKSWLERPESTVIDSIRNSIKVWNSVEFPYMSKYEVIVEHVISVLGKSCDDPEYLTVVNEFVALPSPVGALSPVAKKNLVQAVLSMKATPQDIRRHMDILRTMQLHERFANFFNSNQSLYGEIVSQLFQYHLELLNSKASHPSEHAEEIKLHLKDVKTFCQYNISSESFETTFAHHFIPSLANVVIKCQSIEHPVDKEFFSTIELIYFNSEKSQQLKEYLKNFPEGQLKFFELLPQNHILLLFIEALVANYHNDKETMNLLVTCVYEKMAKEHDKQEILVFRHVLYLLRKYNVNMSQNFKAVPMISTVIMAVVAKRSQTLLHEVIDLICQAVQWNPFVIQDDVLVVIVHFMTLEKDQRTLAKYAELLRRVMSTYTRLNRFEKRTGKLLEMVKWEMDKLKATTSSKRKQNATEPTPSKKKKKNDSSAAEVATEDKDNIFISLLEAQYNTDSPGEEPVWEENWSSLTNIWPKSVAQLWGQSVSLMVSKTSFVIWKSLLINLEEALKLAATRNYEDPPLLYIKFISCFLCEYLSGTRLLEHTDQQYEAIEAMCSQTKEALKSFGKNILETEHNPELVSTFLSVAAKFGCFATSLVYYHPDSVADQSAEGKEEKQKEFKEKVRGVFEFLTTDEWSLIEQRVINFGKESCLSKFTDLNFRKVKSIQLCDADFVCREIKTWNKSIISDGALLGKFLENCVFFEEFVGDLTRKQKITLAKTIFQESQDVEGEKQNEFVKKISEEYEMVEVSALTLFKEIAENHLPEGSLLAEVDFNKLLQDKEFPTLDFQANLEKKKKKKSVKDEEGLLRKLKLITSLPLAFLKEQDKEIIYPLHVILCHDLNGKQEIQEKVLQNLRVIRELGFRFNGLKHLELSSQLEMLTTTFGRSLLMDTVANYVDDAQLKQVKALLKKFAKEESENVDLILLMAHRFSLAKKNHKHEKTMSIYRMKLNKLVIQIYERDLDNQKAAGMLYALNMYLSSKENLAEPNPSLGQLCLRLVARRPLEEDDEEEEHKSKILFFCYQHQSHFELSAEELGGVLQSYWEKVRTIRDVDVISKKTIADVLQQFNAHAPTENYVKILTEIAEMAEKEEEIENLRLVCKLLQSLCPSTVNTAKGVALSEFLKKTMDVIIMKFTLRAENVYDHPEMILDILKCFSVAALNRQIVMSQSLFANILSFALDINFKRFKVTETNTETFEKIHRHLSQLCTSLIQARSLALIHAMPQFVSLMKDLVHTICAFRNERGVAKQKLSEQEVTMLAKLSHRLEPIFNGMADRDHLGRKVAPYLLVYVINEMIFNPNSTTLYPGIKLAINNICYKLIAICDVKYSQFILRGCSEASRDVYKTLVKEYEQYYKFQGKV